MSKALYSFSADADAWYSKLGPTILTSACCRPRSPTEHVQCTSKFPSKNFFSFWDFFSIFSSRDGVCSMCLNELTIFINAPLLCYRFSDDFAYASYRPFSINLSPFFVNWRFFSWKAEECSTFPGTSQPSCEQP